MQYSAFVNCNLPILYFAIGVQIGVQNHFFEQMLNFIQKIKNPQSLDIQDFEVIFKWCDRRDSNPRPTA